MLLSQWERMEFQQGGGTLGWVRSPPVPGGWTQNVRWKQGAQSGGFPGSPVTGRGGGAGVRFPMRLQVELVGLAD